MRFLLAFVVAAFLAMSIPFAQAPAAPAGDPWTAAARAQFAIVKGYLTKTAEKVSEDLYAFKPTPEVRSFGQLLGHTADSNYAICAAALGEKPPVAGIEKTKTTKTDLMRALNDALAYCDKAFAAMDGAKGAEPIKFFGGQQPRLAVLWFNTAHDFEHYGNLVTYMRLKGIVPPSSERGGQ
jgi:uncharacterized damage-inducible protein DinB